MSFMANLPVAGNGWAFPAALLRPFAPLFGAGEPRGSEGFLAGLAAEGLLGVNALPVGGRHRVPLAWVGVALREGGCNLFGDLRGGCWVPGFPAIGRDRELLKRAGMDDHRALSATLGELGLPDKLGTTLYFSFRHDHFPEGGERVYILDGETRRLHGMALPASALAASGAKC